MENTDLFNIVDNNSIQNLMDEFYELTKIPHFMINRKGEILFAAGESLINKLYGENLLNKINKGICNMNYENKSSILIKINDINCIAFPIFISNEYICSLVLGYFYKTKPSENMEEVIPVLKGKRFKNALNYFSILANIINSNIIAVEKRTKELRIKVEEINKELRDVLECDKLRKEFFANLSHEFRTPLNIIFGSLQMIDVIINKDYNYDYKVEKYKGYNKLIRQNSYRLIRLVNNLIDITKIDAGYFNIKLQNCDFIKLVEDITQSVVFFAENKGINLIFDTDVEEKIIACDQDKIERIILNLLSNAIKFTEPGGSIIVSIYEKEDVILTSVKDSGVGIPENKQKDVFERFVQVNKSLSKDKEGSGIGLSLIKSLVEMHHGKIWFESKLGVGSTFYFTIPSIKVDECEENTCEIKNKLNSVNIEFSDVYYL